MGFEETKKRDEAVKKAAAEIKKGRTYQSPHGSLSDSQRRNLDAIDRQQGYDGKRGWW